MSEDGEGGVTTEVRGRILLMGIDRPAKMNGFTPRMRTMLGEAYTRLDDDDDLWCGVLFGHGDHFTAGLDLPKFQEWMRSGNRRRPEDQVDPTALGRRCTNRMVAPPVAWMPRSGSSCEKRQSSAATTMSPASINSMPNV